mgnify:CR=1 FL=1
MTIQPCPFCGRPPKTLREHSGVACPNSECPNHGKFWTGDVWNRLVVKPAPVVEVKP